MKTALVLGAGGFIGSHLVKRLKNAGYTVTAADLKKPEFSPSPADEFLLGDLADPLFCAQVLNRSFDHVYQLAADMGGAGYIFSGEHDADLLHNSALINLIINKTLATLFAAKPQHIPPSLIVNTAGRSCLVNAYI